MSPKLFNKRARRKRQPTNQQPIRYSEVRTPSPPRDNSEQKGNIHEQTGVPPINFRNYWKKRYELISAYEKEMAEFEEFCRKKRSEIYWKFKYQNFILTAQRDFNTEVNKWKESLSSNPIKISVETQTPENSAITTEPTINSAETVYATIEQSNILQNNCSMVIENVFSLQTTVKTEDIKLANRIRKRRWKRYNPGYSYPYSTNVSSSSGSDTEPLDLE